MQKVRIMAYFYYAYTNLRPKKQWKSIWYVEEPRRFKITRLLCKR